MTRLPHAHSLFGAAVAALALTWPACNSAGPPNGFSLSLEGSGFRGTVHDATFASLEAPGTLTLDILAVGSGLTGGKDASVCQIALSVDQFERSGDDHTFVVSPEWASACPTLDNGFRGKVAATYRLAASGHKLKTSFPFPTDIARTLPAKKGKNVAAVTTPKQRASDSGLNKGWKRHTFSDLGFSIGAPGEPRRSKAKTGPLPSERIILSKPGVPGILAVDVAELDKEARGSVDIKAALLDGAKAIVGTGKTLSSRPSMIGKLHAHRIKFTHSPQFGEKLGPVSGEMLFVLRPPKTLLSIGGIHPNGNKAREAVTTSFITSFRLLSSDGAATPAE